MATFAIKDSSRRNFLLTAPAAAAAGLALTDASLFAAPVAGQNLAPAATEPFKLFTAQNIEDDIKALEADPGNRNLVADKTFGVMLTVEKEASAKEFEWHEHRDHVIQIIDGETIYEVGGTPKGGHNVGPGEWLAPESVGATTYTLKKGDMLVLPRGTLHKRSTPKSVILTLIAPRG
jgi:quercetin dioxygenase-like cupin family protein